MKPLTIKGEQQRALAVLVVVVLLFLLPTLGTYVTYLTTRILFYSLASMTIVFLSGYCGVMSFAQVSFMGIAGYCIASGTTVFGLSYAASAAIAIGLTVGVSAVFSLICMRTKGNYYLMMTVAFCQLIYLGAMQWVKISGGFNGLTGVPTPRIGSLVISSTQSIYYFTLIIAGICYFLLHRLVHSPYGIALQGIRDHEKKMSAMGFPVLLMKYLSYVIAALFAAVAGILSIAFYGVISPSTITMASGISLLFTAMIGGSQRLEGALIGTVIYVLLENEISTYTERYQLFLGIFFVLVVLFMPKGVLGLNWKGWWQKLRSPAKGKAAVK